MSIDGTRRHRVWCDTRSLAPVVRSALEAAEAMDFPWSCTPETGALLAVLARGVDRGVIGEAGTGAGVGLAWMIDATSPATRFVSVERDPVLHRRARRTFAGRPHVTLLAGDAALLLDHGPFDLVFLDGGGAGKHDDALDPRRLLAVGGTAVVDDLTPSPSWPPTWEGAPDPARMFWYDHPDVTATEVRVAPDATVLLATRVR